MFIPKNIAVVVGHSILKNGQITSADGRKHGGVIEYYWCKEFSPILVETFKEEGVKATLFICPERQFTSAREEMNWKLSRLNGKGFDLIIENHLNCYNGKARGTETLFSKGSARGQEVAQRTNDKLDDLYPDRGVKARDDLYILRKTQPVAILNEYFFCDSMEDYKLSDEHGEMKEIARKVVEGVLNKSVPNKPPIANGGNTSNGTKVYPNGDYDRKARLTANLNFRVNRGSDYGKVKTLPKGTVITVNYCKNNWFSTYDVTYFEDGKNKPTFCCGEFIELI